MGKKAKYLVLQFKCRISSVWRHTCHDKRQQVFGPQNAMWSKSQFYIQLLYKQKFENMNSTVWEIGKYSQVPIKRVGPNKQVGWIFYVLNK